MAQQLSATTADPSRVIWHLCQQLEFFADHKPVLLKQLTQGKRTSSYQVQTNRGHYVLRHYGPSVLGVCRQQELRCQHAAAAVVNEASRSLRDVAGSGDEMLGRDDDAGRDPGRFRKPWRPAFVEIDGAHQSGAARCLDHHGRLIPVYRRPHSVPR